MKYDFTSVLERHGKDAMAVDSLGNEDWAPKAPEDGFDAIPMWVADMNFPTVPGPCLPPVLVVRPCWLPTIELCRDVMEAWPVYSPPRLQMLSQEQS